MATQEHPDEEPINLSPHIGLPDSPSTMATQEHPDEEPILDELNLISYFLVEQMLLCSGNPKMPRSSFWGLVTDLKVFEEINWAKAVFDHIFESLKVLKEKETAGISGQRLFKGAAPVLEAILYERIASVRPPNLNVEFLDPPIQKYGAQRSDFSEKLHKLTPDQIKPCPWCGFQRLALEDGAGFQGLAMEDGACSPAPSLAEVAPEKNGATTPKKAPPKPRNTKKADTTAPIAEPMETSSSAMETAPGALRRSTRIRTPRAPLSPSPLPTKKSRPKKGC